MFRFGDETEERDPLSWVDLKDSPNKKDHIDTWQMLQNPPRHRLESFRQTRERQNTLNTKLNSAVDENDRASATTGQHQDSQHRQKAYMSQIVTYRTRITTNR